MACPGFNLPAVKACPAYIACMTADGGSGKAICRRCYSQKGRYKWNSVVNALDRRWEWWLSTKPLARAKELAEAAKANGSPRYFRCYDSGDLCMQAEDTWLAFADRLPDTLVWIPTRTWILPERLPALLKLAEHPRIVVRPSAMCFGDNAPAVPGLAAGTTSPLPGQDPEEIANHTCPGGCGDCRICWTRPMLSVAYARK